MSAGVKRAVGVAALFGMSLFAISNGHDASAYIAAIILVQVL